MKTKVLMINSAIFMGVTGIALSFLPQEALKAIDIPVNGGTTLLLQIMGALYFGFAMLNWMAKGVLMGGIYARPLIIGNLAHFLIGSITLGKSLLSDFWLPVLVVFIAYLLLAIGFGLALFKHPTNSKQ